MDAVMTTSIQLPNHKVKFTTSSQSWFYDLAPTLPQPFKEREILTSSQLWYYDVAATLCQPFKECGMWTIHGCMVEFP